MSTVEPPTDSGVDRAVRVRILFAREGDRWLAQCLDYDVGITLPPGCMGDSEFMHAMKSIERVLQAQYRDDVESGVAPMSRMRKAPDKFWRMYAEDAIDVHEIRDLPLPDVFSIRSTVELAWPPGWHRRDTPFKRESVRRIVYQLDRFKRSDFWLTSKGNGVFELAACFACSEHHERVPADVVRIGDRAVHFWWSRGTVFIGAKFDCWDHVSVYVDAALDKDAVTTRVGVNRKDFSPTWRAVADKVAMKLESAKPDA